MKKNDITNDIKKLYLAEEIEKISQEIVAEFKDGIPSEHNMELEVLLKKCNQESANVLTFPTRKSIKLAEVELLAAASKNQTADIISQPLIFMAEGFSVDIRRVIGSENNVTLYFEALEKKEKKMETLFQPYAGAVLELELPMNGNRLLTASIYVDESARIAEGEGTVFETEIELYSSKIEINIIKDD